MKVRFKRAEKKMKIVVNASPGEDGKKSRHPGDGHPGYLLQMYNLQLSVLERNSPRP